MKRDEAMKLAERGLAELNTALQQGASETLVRYLDVLARFHRYSFGNVMLIASQKPDATRVAGFHTWRKLGRWVKKGEQGIAIFAPMVGRKRHDDCDDAPADEHTENLRQLFGFRVVHVFDISQTEGDELPEFARIDGDPGERLSRLEGIVADYGIQLEYDFPGGGALGVSRDGSIVVCPDMLPAETFAVLAHELAHELLHQQTGRKSQVSRTVRETEAEAVAYVVCRAMGLETTTRSADYIHMYQGDPTTLSESLDAIQKTAALLIEQLQQEPVLTT
jgi:antirestriction protein ArdC